jgi:hypothetical protein
LQRCVHAIAHQVTSFVKQHSSAFSIVNRELEKIRIERYDFERKIRGCVRVPMPSPPVPPIIGAPENHQVFENESLAIEALLLQECDCLLNLLALIGPKSIRTHQKGNITNPQNE